MNTTTSPTRLNWLKSAPIVPSGVTWGIPWEEGTLQRDELLSLTTPSGKQIPTQSWPTAFWADGSVKWTAHSACFNQDVSAEHFSLGKGVPATPDVPLQIEANDEEIQVNTGRLLFKLGRQGNSIIRSIHRGNSTICTDGRLICIREEQNELSGNRVLREEHFQSKILRTVIEQSGPVRGVVRIEGVHQNLSGTRQWLPFKLRLYFYTGVDSFNVVHSFIYDGNPHKDFIKGLGMAFSVPMSGPLYNRHVRIAGDNGFFSESPKHLMTIRTTGKYQDLYRKQFYGEPIAFDSVEDEKFLGLLADSPVWDSFKIVQNSTDNYTIWKRTKETCSWLKAGEGRRAGGLLLAGSEGGGLAVGVKNFWEKHPSSLEAEQVSKDESILKVWFWSPDTRVMDLRHYDTETHVTSSYEGFEEMRSTPYGIANTSELRIWCLEETPDQELLRKLVEETRSPALLRCEPEYYHQAKAFGVWSLPDRSTPAKTFLEGQLDEAVQFYKEEVEQRRWYGFWDYGDFMHSYDPVRHTWRYDIGGCAWQNTELVPNMWLWYMFLRSGREDVFRLAEAMTRHTSEVDVYHIGEYAGLGSRHNVVHWGCGCKEARISMAGLHRFYYYLTADERIGDIMDEVKDSDYTTQNLDPMRAYFPKDEYPTHARMGPDWSSFTSNWLTRWERYEDTAYRDKLKAGIECLKQLPFRLTPLATYGYDPKTGELFYMGKDSGGHLAVCMGGPQVWIESTQMLKDPVWEEMLAEVGAFYNLPREEKIKRTEGVIPGRGYGHHISSAGLTAYASVHNGDRELAQLAWRLVFSSDGYGTQKYSQQMQTAPDLEHILANPLHELPWLSTNMVSQWSLNVIMCLELIGEELPHSLEEARALALL
ncbi:MAG: hypothetical protein JWN30_213 [Bacilli bacterium]|nr:hypothetical protein [Bacilli bacterium]